MSNDLIIDTHDKSLAPYIPQDHLAALAEFLRLNLAEGDASRHTQRSIYTSIQDFSQWAARAGVNPVRATEDDVKAYRAWLIGKGQKPSTILVKLVALRKLFQAAVWRGYRPDNPAKGIKAPSDKTDPSEKIKFLPFEGFQKLLAYPDPKTLQGRRDRAILALLGRHGLRVFEVAKMTLDDLGSDGAIRIVGKGKRVRTIHLTPGTKPILDAWLKDRRPIRTEAHTVFVALGNRSYGGPMTTRGIRHLVDKYLAKCGLKAEGISCHSLRHSFGTWAYHFGADPRYLQDAMGHTSPDTTAIYQGLADKATHNPALLFDNRL